MMKLPSIYVFIIETLKEVVTKSLLLHFLVNLLFGYLTHYFTSKYTSMFHDDDIITGKYYWLGSIVLGLISRWYHQNYVRPTIEKLRSNTIILTEEKLTEKIVNLNWADMKKLEEKGFGDLKNKLIWPYAGFVTSLISLFMTTVIPLGFALWSIAELSILFAMMYVLAIPLVVYLTKSPKREIDKWIELWAKYDRIQAMLTNKAIHHDKEDIMKANSDVFREMETLSIHRRTASSKQEIIASVVLTTISIIGLFFFLDTVDSGTILLTLIHQFTIFRNSVIGFFALNTQNTDARKEFDVIEEKLLSKSDQKQYPQYLIRQGITIENIDFKRNGFKLQNSNPLCFELGKAYRLHGRKGSGKSTFFDLVAGIIGSSNIKIDDISAPDGFSNLTACRLYHRQKTRLAKKTSIYDLVSDNYGGIVDNTDEVNVMKALDLCKCDFASLTGEDGKKWIHEKEPGFSGGQEDIISLATTMYQLLTKKNIQIVLLDEPDSSIENESVVDFMRSIVDICKRKNILLICILHTEKAQIDVPFDTVMNFNDGKISYD